MQEGNQDGTSSLVWHLDGRTPKGSFQYMPYHAMIFKTIQFIRFKLYTLPKYFYVILWLNWLTYNRRRTFCWSCGDRNNITIYLAGVRARSYCSYLCIELCMEICYRYCNNLGFGIYFLFLRVWKKSRARSVPWRHRNRTTGSGCPR